MLERVGIGIRVVGSWGSGWNWGWVGVVITQVEAQGRQFTGHLKIRFASLFWSSSDVSIFKAMQVHDFSHQLPLIFDVFIHFVCVY